MPSRLLTEDEFSETLRRAQEIAYQSRDLASPEPAYETYLKAAEEVGVPRDALLQALRERLLIPSESLEVGGKVFAPSVDGACYPATITRLDGQSVTVEFVSGGEHTCTLSDLQPLALMPGRKIQFNFGSFWGWLDATVTKYDPARGQVVVESGFDTARGSLSKVRLAPVKPQKPRAAGAVSRLLFWTALAAGSAGTGLGFLLSHLLR